MRVDWKSFTKHYTRPEKGQFPVGSRVYIGRQGKGKTLSMVDYTYRLIEAYPKARVFSNVLLFGVEYRLIESDDDVALAIGYQNGANGVLVLLDEAHLMFNTKTGIPIDVLTAISQQRKDRRRIVFSSQIWNELDISVRKQVQEVVQCRNIGRFQWNRIFDGESIELDKSNYSYKMDKIGSELYKHNDDFYARYDTYQKIIRNSEYNRATAPTAVAVVQSEAKKGRK